MIAGDMWPNGRQASSALHTDGLLGRGAMALSRLGVVAWIAAAFLSTTAPHAVADQGALSDRVEDVRGTRVIELSIDSSKAPTRFRLVGSAKNVIVSIEVLPRDSETPVQVLAASMEEPPWRGSQYFFASDVNCDGYADLHLLSWSGSSGNAGYTIWRFDPRTSRFVLDEVLSGLPIIEIDCSKGEIIAQMGSGLGGQEYESHTYKYVDGELVLIRRVRSEYRQEICSFRLTIEERRGDRVVSSSEEFEKAEEWCYPTAAAHTPVASRAERTPSPGM